jgi:hypothetical protein
LYQLPVRNRIEGNHHTLLTTATFRTVSPSPVHIILLRARLSPSWGAYTSTGICI